MCEQADKQAQKLLLLNSPITIQAGTQGEGHLMKSLRILPLLLVLGGCTGTSVRDQMNAASEGRALEAMADNLSSKEYVQTCTILRDKPWFGTESVSIHCF